MLWVLRVSWSFMILPAKMRHSWSACALNFLETASLNCRHVRTKREGEGGGEERKERNKHKIRDAKLTKSVWQLMLGVMPKGRRLDRERQREGSLSPSSLPRTYFFYRRILLNLDGLLFLWGFYVDGDLFRTTLLLAFCHLGSVDDSLLSTLARYSVRGTWYVRSRSVYPSLFVLSASLSLPLDLTIAELRTDDTATR